MTLVHPGTVSQKNGLKDYEFTIWACPEGSKICPKSKYIRYTSYCKNEDFLKVPAKFTHLGSPMTEVPHFWNLRQFWKKSGQF